jgi:hypothetical protein
MKCWYPRTQCLRAKELEPRVPSPVEYLSCGPEENPSSCFERMAADMAMIDTLMIDTIMVVYRKDRRSSIAEGL